MCAREYNVVCAGIFEIGACASAAARCHLAFLRGRARGAVLRTAAEQPREAAPSFTAAITKAKEATEGPSCCDYV